MQFLSSRGFPRQMTWLCSTCYRCWMHWDSLKTSARCCVETFTITHSSSNVYTFISSEYHLRSMGSTSREYRGACFIIGVNPSLFIIVKQMGISILFFVFFCLGGISAYLFSFVSHPFVCIYTYLLFWLFCVFLGHRMTQVSCSRFNWLFIATLRGCSLRRCVVIHCDVA